MSPAPSWLGQWPMYRGHLRAFAWHCLIRALGVPRSIVSGTVAAGFDLSSPLLYSLSLKGKKKKNTPLLCSAKVFKILQLTFLIHHFSFRMNKCSQLSDVRSQQRDLLVLSTILSTLCILKCGQYFLPVLYKQEPPWGGWYPWQSWSVHTNSYVCVTLGVCGVSGDKKVI